MRTYPIVEAKSKFSALLAAVEAGEEVAITRHGRVVARIVPDQPRMAAELFRPFWDKTDLDIEAPADINPEAIEGLD
ncbi:MAG: type II toxin-antitoxin system Phd/YefM family antitoxin [Gammaproteobacteria bacterium]